jgi:glyoxylase-like metal-dependent hydrolase (beta-lactamase superfamily II)
MKSPSVQLPRDIHVFERGWLSSNNILLLGRDHAALVDSGYGAHAAQTVALVDAALSGRPLDGLVNTHLHSDHCGGNAALQQHYPGLLTLIPPGLSRHVTHWDPHALTFTPTGQTCPQVRFDAVLTPGSAITLGDRLWQVHAAPGHDTHSVILFEPQTRVLLSADALWERGFGVVFPELEGQDAFASVGATLDLIEALAPAVVIPGHGPVFSDVAAALANARARLDGFVTQPVRHIQYAVKVLLKFKLLEVQALPLRDLLAWAGASAYFGLIHQREFAHVPFAAWVEGLVADLVRSGAASYDGALVKNAG